MEELDYLFRWVEGRILMESVFYLKENYNTKDIVVLIIGDHSFYPVNRKKIGIDKFHFIPTKILKEAIEEVPVNLTEIENEIAMNSYDIIMCNMTMHQLFKEGTLLNNFLELAHNQLKENGLLIGIAIDGDKVNRLFMHREEIARGLYRLENKIDVERTMTPYGNVFEVEIDAQEDKKDQDDKTKKNIQKYYAVTIPELIEVAGKNNFLFVGTVDFPTWFARYQERKYDKLTKEQKEFAFLHFSYFFKKRETQVANCHEEC